MQYVHRLVAVCVMGGVHEVVTSRVVHTLRKEKEFPQESGEKASYRGGRSHGLHYSYLDTCTHTPHTHLLLLLLPLISGGIVASEMSGPVPG